jgi:hypothetical protein
VWVHIFIESKVVEELDDVEGSWKSRWKRCDVGCQQSRNLASARRQPPKRVRPECIFDIFKSAMSAEVTDELVPAVT